MIEAIADEVRRAREARGWSRRELEDQAGVPARSVERLELKKSSPRAEVLIALCAALQLDLGRLQRGICDPSLSEIMEGLVGEHGAQHVLHAAVRAAFREKE